MSRRHARPYTTATLTFGDDDVEYVVTGLVEREAQPTHDDPGHDACIDDMEITREDGEPVVETADLIDRAEQALFDADGDRGDRGDDE